MPGTAGTNHEVRSLIYCAKLLHILRLKSGLALGRSSQAATVEALRCSGDTTCNSGACQNQGAPTPQVARNWGRLE